MKNPAVNILHHSLAAAIYRDLPEVTELRRDRDTWNNCSQEEQADHIKHNTVPQTEHLRRPYESEVTVTMFEQGWGSTALGFGGIGGAAMTAAYTVIVECFTGVCAVYFDGSLAYIVDPNNFSAKGRELWHQDIADHNMPAVGNLGKYHRSRRNIMKIENIFDKDAEILHEMANVYDEDHGVKNVVIWVGSVVNLPHGLRIKVSNIPNKFDRINNFTIQMPSLYYDPIKVARWIDDEKLQQILTWIRVNQKILYDYETGIMDNTRLFLQQLEPWNSGSNKPDQGEK